MMNNIDRLIADFRSEETSAIPNPDADSIKDTIISELEEYCSEEKVLSFLLEVATNSNEYDLARIEAFKILYVRPIGNDTERDRIGLAIEEVLISRKENEIVRNYAAIAASSYMACPRVVNAIEQIAIDTEENRNLRACAFDAIERNHASTRSIRILQVLSKDSHFHQTAKRVLQEWGVTS
jgi:hypothetical protein